VGEREEREEDPGQGEGEREGGRHPREESGQVETSLEGDTG